MILFIECVAACIVFGVGITISTFINREWWIREYPPNVQARYMESHPEFVVRRREGGKIKELIAKLVVCVIFLLLLMGLAILAGARNFLTAFLETYLIWTVVNLFDVFALDLGLLMYWKKIRLPGTEDMDKEYTTNKLHHIKEGVYGVLIGLPICLLAALLVAICF